MAGNRKAVKKFNNRLKTLIKQGYVNVNGTRIMAANYVFRILDDKDPLFTPENIERLLHSKVLYTKEGERLVIRRELIRLNHAPTDAKFITIQDLNNYD